MYVRKIRDIRDDLAAARAERAEVERVEGLEAVAVRLAVEVAGLEAELAAAVARVRASLPFFERVRAA